MKHLWANEELIGHFTLSPAELKLLAKKQMRKSWEKLVGPN
jgi:hypothetical protein